MSSPKNKVVLFGGTSYVGQFLLQSLLASEIEIIAVTHNPTSARILLTKHMGSIRIVSFEEAMKEREDGVTAVINLAYVRTASPHRANRENQRLIQEVHETAVHHGSERVIHASTIAVFGYEPTTSPAPTDVFVRPGNFYIETKARAEHMLRQSAARGGYNLSVVRLGNIVGPGSAAWTAGLAQRLLEGKPLGTYEAPGYSNATYIENTASYLSHLAGVPKAELDQFGIYHHLAEFSSHSWDEFLTAFENAVGLTRVRVEAGPSSYGTSFSHVVGTSLRQAYRGRLGSYARSLTGKLPWIESLDAALLRLKNLDAPEAHLKGAELLPEDRPLLGLLASRVRVAPHTVPGWTPAVQFEVALERMAAWLRESGYAVRSSR